MRILFKCMLLLLITVGACSGSKPEVETKDHIPLCSGSVTAEGPHEGEGSSDGEYPAEVAQWISELDPLKAQQHMELERNGYLYSAYDKLTTVGLADVHRCEKTWKVLCVDTVPMRVTVRPGEEFIIWFASVVPEKFTTTQVAVRWTPPNGGEPVTEYASVEPSPYYRSHKRIKPDVPGEWKVEVWPVVNEGVKQTRIFIVSEPEPMAQ